MTVVFIAVLAYSAYNSHMKINISHIAKLANLPLSDQEKDKFEKQLSTVITYMTRLSKVDTKNVEETTQITGLENVMREDKVFPSLSQKDSLSEAKQTTDGFFAVKGIFDNE